jgi:hypothetical protein
MNETIELVLPEIFSMWVRIYPLLGNGCFLCCGPTRGYIKKANSSGYLFQKTGLSVQSPSSSDNDKLKVATVVRQTMKELSEAVSEEDKVMIITMMVLKLMQRNGCRFHMPLRVIVFGANGSMSSVNSFKTRIKMRLCFQRLVSNHMRGCIVLFIVQNE